MANNFHPFHDMKERAKAQHEVDRANFEAVKVRGGGARGQRAHLGRHLQGAR